jgi:hypothetical protein
MSIDEILHRVFSGRAPAPLVEPPDYLLRQLISDESNAWNLAALAVARQEWGPKDAVSMPGAPAMTQPSSSMAAPSPSSPGTSAQEQTLHWNERALERLRQEHQS